MHVKIIDDKFIQFIGTETDIKKFQDLYNESDNKFAIPVKFKVEMSLNEKIQEIEKWVIDDYRPLFKNLKQGSMGDRYGCIQKMALFMIVHPEYSKDDITTAAKSYIQSFNSDHTYMMQADYFIFKQVRHQGKEMITSKLLTWLEDGPEQYVSKDFFDSIN
jgi:hypothetical protein